MTSNLTTTGIKTEWNAAWIVATHKGELYSHTGDYVGQVQWDKVENTVYIVAVEYGRVIRRLPQTFNASDFEKCGTARFSANKTVSKWRLRA